MADLHFLQPCISPEWELIRFVFFFFFVSPLMETSSLQPPSDAAAAVGIFSNYQTIFFSSVIAEMRCSQLKKNPFSSYVFFPLIKKRFGPPGFEKEWADIFRGGRSGVGGGSGEGFQGGFLGGLIAADEQEEKLGSKVYAPNTSPSSVHSERDASLIIAILTLRTKGRIALNYICRPVHSR